MSNALLIIEQMVLIENSWQPFKDVDADFRSISFLPSTIPGATPDGSAYSYPVSFRLPPRGHPTDYATGQRGNMVIDALKPIQRWTEEIDVAIMVAPASNPSFGLVEMALEFVEPFYRCYLANFRLNGTVTDITVGTYRMGKFTFNDTQHFGVVFPTTARYRKQDSVSG